VHGLDEQRTTGWDGKVGDNIQQRTAEVPAFARFTRD
jgi:hypothetical protein